MKTRENVTAALRRRFGMSPEMLGRLTDFNKKQTDWYSRCRVCGKERHGSIEELRRPCCDPKGK